MRNKKHNILCGFTWFILSVIIAILLQYNKQTKDDYYDWADSFPVWIGGSIKGSVSALIFLTIDYLVLKKIKLNKKVKLLLRSLVLLLIVLLVSSKMFYNW